MTHRDRAGDPPGQGAGRRGAAGDAGHRKPCAPSKSIGPSESLGKRKSNSG